jgi:acyl-CoA thioesterase I
MQYMKPAILLLTLACTMVCLAGNPGAAESKKMAIQGDSLVLAKTTPGNLCFDNIVKGSVAMRSTFLPGKPGSIVYAEEADFVVNYSKGAIARTANSRIPDYSLNPLYAVVDFRHENYTNASNHPYFVWVDYQTTNGKPFAGTNDQTKYLAIIRKKLEAGFICKVVSYGDSIAAGGEASEADLRFQARFGKYLQGKFPKSNVQIVDASIPGYTSQQGVDWFDKYLGPVEKPDLVLLGFGMNDHNITGFGVDVEQFKQNFITTVKMIRERKGAEVIIFSTMPPNDNWHYGSHRMGQYAEAAKQAAAEVKCAYVDVYSVWLMVLRRKDQPSLLGNNINHPNDFGHWLYEQAFEAMKF